MKYAQFIGLSPSGLQFTIPLILTEWTWKNTDFQRFWLLVLCPAKWFLRSVWSQLSNKVTIVSASGPCTYWTGRNHHTTDEIQLTYLFISPPVIWFHIWVDTFPCINQFLCCSIRHMFPEGRLLHNDLNAFYRMAVKEMCAIIVAKGVWPGQTIETHCRISKSWCPSHRRFCSTVWISMGRSKVSNYCHHRVSEMLVDCSSAQVVRDAHQQQR